MLSKMDDYPIHQISDIIRHVSTSDRNFFDRYYFNLHCASDELFVVIGFGQYPTLGVQDAFVLVRYGDHHDVVRASKVIEDRSDIQVGPISIEILEGLQKIRIVLNDNESNIKMDVVWEGEHFPYLEPRHYIRKRGRVLFDTMRFAQLGRWQGSLSIGAKQFDITPDRWIGSRDRCWGVRPVGEAEPPGIHAGDLSMTGMWNYFPVLFDDFALMYIVNENNDGSRTIEEAVKIWKDPNREPEHLGRPEHDHEFVHAEPLKASIKKAVVRFPDAPGGPLELVGEPYLETYVTIGTGYGFESDWRHGMFQGEEVTQVAEYLFSDSDSMWGLIETPATFRLGDKKGVGMLEFGFFGDFDQYTKGE